MVKTRLIPVLLLQNGLLVRSELFETHQVIGDPLHEVKRFNEWNVDELIYLDITKDDAPDASAEYDAWRGDHKTEALTNPLDLLDAVSRTCFMPLTFGGRITSVEQMLTVINHGADKLTLNSAAVRTPQLIQDGAKIFGSQAIVVSIDAFCHEDGRTEVYIDGGRTATGLTPEDWAAEAEKWGAGEILLQSINRDGVGTGYDLDLIRAVTSRTSIPVIACSGVGRYEQYAKGVEAGAAAVAAANIWHFRELSDRGGKRALAKAGVNVRL